MTTTASSSKPGAQLRKLLARKDQVLAVMHPPTAMHARLMEQAGAECAFIGTSGVVGAYTGMSDVGTASMTECVMISGWVAQSVKIPIIMDGDTGHGGIMAVRRMVRECIKAGLAGVRIDDQPIEGKRRTQSAGLEVVPLEQAIARYRAAVDMKNELDPDFVIMSQCYARDAANGGEQEALRRLQAYEQDAGVDWVQLESPHSTDEIRRARAKLKGAFSFMKGQMPRNLNFAEHLELGVNIAWYAGLTHHVTWAALWDFMQAFKEKDLGAWQDFQASRKGKPYPRPETGPEGEGLEMQRKLEEKYFSSGSLEKYRRSGGGDTNV